MIRALFNKLGKNNSTEKDNFRAGFGIEQKLQKVLDGNIEMLKKIFKDDDTLITRNFENQQENSIKCCILFIDGMINPEIINENILQPIMMNRQIKKESGLIDKLQSQVIVSDNIEKASDVNTLVKAVLSGDTVLLLDGSAEALIISTKGWQTRSIGEPESEKVFRGPREGFTESLMINLSLVRRKVQTPDLKFKFKTLGIRTHTKACICYIESIASKDVLNELLGRLDDIKIDGFLDTGYIQEMIKDSPFSPFKTIGNTERPDIAAAKLLEGRIIVLLEGTPVALTLPFVFMEYFQTNEDYYVSFYFASINKLLRALGSFIAISAPAVYVAFITFHLEMIPSPLLLAISSARQGIPVPSIVEALELLTIFELVRETGSRMPTSIGQAVSIVGTLVIGQAAVEARFVSAPMVIVIALTGITGLLIPKLKSPSILFRFVFLFLAAFIGLYGYFFGLLGLFIHLYGMRSFGVPYMLNIALVNPQQLKDTAIRAPWWYMDYRSKLIARNDYIRKSHSKSRGSRS